MNKLVLLVGATAIAAGGYAVVKYDEQIKDFVAENYSYVETKTVKHDLSKDISEGKDFLTHAGLPKGYMHGALTKKICLPGGSFEYNAQGPFVLGVKNSKFIGEPTPFGIPLDITFKGLYVAGLTTKETQEVPDILVFATSADSEFGRKGIDMLCEQLQAQDPDVLFKNFPKYMKNAKEEKPEINPELYGGFGLIKNGDAYVLLLNVPSDMVNFARNLREEFSSKTYVPPEPEWESKKYFKNFMTRPVSEQDKKDNEAIKVLTSRIELHYGKDKFMNLICSRAKKEIGMLKEKAKNPEVKIALGEFYKEFEK